VFDSIQGRVALREPARVVIEAGGLGYLVHVPLATYDALPPVGREARLLLHLVVREDEWRLYGFATAREREAFRDLLTVSGVGPASALLLLSGLGPDALMQAVAEADVKALTRVKGVGKKTAERVLLELKDRWAAHAAASGARPAGVPAAGPGADAVKALEALGLDRAEAEQRVARLTAGGAAADLPLAELVRRALKG
jgi:Holliday junction DNA helicase RuvA